MKLLRYIAEFICWIWVGSLLMAYVAPFVDPRTFWMPAIFGLAWPLIALGSLFWLIAMLFVRARWWWVLLVAMLPGIPYWSELFNPSGPAERIPADSYEVVSFNTRVLGKYDNNDISSALFSFAEVRKPDIICLQEVLISPTELRALLQKTEYSHYWLTSYVERGGRKQKFGKVTLSRHPVVGKGVLQLPGSPLRFANYLDVQLADKVVRVFNIHLQKTRVTDTDYEYLQEQAADYERTWNFSIRLAGKLVRAFKQRAEQADFLSKAIAESPYPVLVCGDLNDTRLGYTYRRISEGLQDAFSRTGYGNGQTYLGPVPFLRLDYTLFSPDLEVYSCRYFDDISSDHKLVLTKFN